MLHFHKICAICFHYLSSFPFTSPVYEAEMSLAESLWPCWPAHSIIYAEIFCFLPTFAHCAYPLELCSSKIKTMENVIDLDNYSFTHPRVPLELIYI